MKDNIWLRIAIWQVMRWTSSQCLFVGCGESHNIVNRKLGFGFQIYIAILRNTGQNLWPLHGFDIIIIRALFLFGRFPLTSTRPHPPSPVFWISSVFCKSIHINLFDNISKIPPVWDPIRNSVEALNIFQNCSSKEVFPLATCQVYNRKGVAEKDCVFFKLIIQRRY
jgi:hypothetical protein